LQKEAKKTRNSLKEEKNGVKSAILASGGGTKKILGSLNFFVPTFLF